MISKSEPKLATQLRSKVLDVLWWQERVNFNGSRSFPHVSAQGAVKVKNGPVQKNGLLKKVLININLKFKCSLTVIYIQLPKKQSQVIRQPCILYAFEDNKFLQLILCDLSKPLHLSALGPYTLNRAVSNVLLQKKAVQVIKSSGRLEHGCPLFR